MLAVYGLTVLLCHCRASIIDHLFSEVKSCVETDSMFDSSVKNWTVQTRLQCATACAVHVDCKAFRISRAKPLTCVLHSRTLQTQVCTSYPVDEYVKYNNMGAKCLNGGVPNSGGGCSCFDGYIGDRCQQLIEDCSDAKNSGLYNSNGEMLIHPTESPDPFPVFCSMTWTGRTYLTHRADGLVNFNRPWADYKAGFGQLSGDHWLGFDKMHYLTTSRDYLLTIEVEISDSQPYRQHFYGDFTIGDETTGYAFNFNYNSPKASPHELTDCLVPAKGRRFTTTDVDNDDVAGSNCASVHEGGWWFTDCGECNPTGPMTFPADGKLLGIPNEIFWKPGLSPSTVIKFHMYVGPP